MIMFILVSEKLGIAAVKYVLHADGTDINDHESLIAFAGEIIVALKEGEEWVKQSKEHLLK